MSHVPNPDPQLYIPTEQNLPRLYSEYDQYEHINAGGRVLHVVTSRLLRPTVSFGETTDIELKAAADHIPEDLEHRENIEQRVGRWLAARKPVLALINHQFRIDNFHDLAAMRSNPALRPIAKLGAIAAKSEYFDLPEDASRRDRIESYAYRMLRAFPTTRQSDLDRVPKPAELSDKEFSRQKLASLGSAATHWSAYILGLFKKGQPVLIYPEGTRKRGDWSQVGDIMAGVPRLIEAAAKSGIELGVLIGGRSYGTKQEPENWRDLNLRRPHLHFSYFQGGGFHGNRSERTRMRKLIPREMQASSEISYDIAKHRVKSR